MNYNEKIKELTEKFIQEMESLKNKNQLLKVEKEKDLSRFDEHFKLADEKNNQVKNKKNIFSLITDLTILGKSRARAKR